MEAATRGDPVAEVTWCSLSLRDLERQMAGLGFRCGKDAVARMLREDGYSLQGMSRVLEGRQHPDRDAQFRRINAMIAEFAAAGDRPVSVDAKKKEQLGPYHRDGRSWRPAGEPVRVRDHDFPDEELGKITPYGVYDIAANSGFVSVGTSCDTAAFAVNALRLWWQREGSLRYPGARRLLVACDAGGSNSCTRPAVEDQLAVLAEETGTGDHGVPLPARHEQVEQDRAPAVLPHHPHLAGPAADDEGRRRGRHRRDHHLPGPEVHRRPRRGRIPQGQIRSADQRMKYLEEHVLDRGAIRGEWNYAVPPAPRPAPDPEPDPEPARPPPQAVPNHPALTGLDPAGLHALAAALEVQYGAHREQATTPAADADTSTPSGTGTAQRPAQGRPHRPRARPPPARAPAPARQAIGALLGVDATTAGHATALTTRLLAARHPASSHRPAAGPPAHARRTAGLRRRRRGHPHYPGQRPGHAATLQDTRREPATRPELITDAAYSDRNCP